MVWERHRWESHLELRIYQPWCGRLFHPEVVQPSKPPDFSTTSSSLAPMLPKDLFTVVPFYHSTTITLNWKCEGITTRWFKVTFSSPSWRSLNHWKGSLSHPKRVTLNHQAHISSVVWSFLLFEKTVRSFRSWLLSMAHSSWHHKNHRKLFWHSWSPKIDRIQKTDPNCTNPLFCSDFSKRRLRPAPNTPWLCACTTSSHGTIKVPMAGFASYDSTVLWPLWIFGKPPETETCYFYLFFFALEC